MFLKSLSLRGFKTFSDPTEIEFGAEARITAVVGPNGCGKSNLLDAVRWVLGEDNPRQLRVAALPDIIFAGTDRRKPLSLAEISIVFDNASGALSIPYTELAIRRRAFREGESEFYINKNLCRLKDIKDLLLDTGLGEGSYSIITQGQVDAILSSKGEERRAVFEEAAGINKYKTRKLSAERKLIAAEQNILRINDLKLEVSEHILTLEEQAGKAREYLKVQAAVKETELGLCRRLLGGILEKKTKIEAELAAARQASEEKISAEKKDENELQALKEELRKIEIAIEEQAVRLDAEKDRLRDLELNRRFVEGEIQREERKIQELESRKIELNKKIENLKLKHAAGASPRLAVGGGLAESLEAVFLQAHQLFNLITSIAAFLGREEPFLPPERKEIEAARDLQVEILTEEIKKLEEEKERARFALHALKSTGEVKSAPENKTTIFEGLAQLKQKREELRRAVAGLEEKIRREGASEREAGGAITALEIAAAKLEGEILGLGEKLASEYNLSLREIESLPHTVANVARARQEVDEGKRRLRELEPVNLLAIEEFERMRERLSFIETQLLDLNSARENLQNLIVELDRRAAETFLETMQQLSIVFSETFARLFVGGEARISLAPDAPVLEAEIEVSVRPAGRRWLPLSLLSGGERSLCAIAILFSLLKIRPAPFCFLDEVDAALDEANIGRFTAMLKDFSAASQIIIITHNKRTMEVADNIYGVTMEEPGVSKVISMHLTGSAVA